MLEAGSWNLEVGNWKLEAGNCAVVIPVCGFVNVSELELRNGLHL
jgi:hypothetical protein